jgi:hypothetical protein
VGKDHLAGGAAPMTRACHLPIDLATGGVFSDEEKADIIDRLIKKRARIKGERPTASDREALSAAMDELSGEEIKAALLQQRMELYSKRAKAGRETQLASLPGDVSDRLRALNVGTEKQGLASGRSVDAVGKALGTKLMSIADAGLKAEPGLQGRMSNFFGVGENGFDRLVAREMARLNGASIEATGDRGAEIAARVLNRAVAEGRRMQNAAGAWIGELPGYITRQQHDRLKVAGGFWRELRAAGPGALGDWSGAGMAASRKAFREWHDFIRPRLDDGTFKGIDPDDVHLRQDAAELHASGVLKDPADLRERFLYHAWFNIVSGGQDALAGASDLGEFRPPAGKARAVSKARVLHFKGPDDWMDYHERFGTGSLYSAVLGDLDRAGRNTALMETWGPAPDAAFENTRAELTKTARARGDAGAAGRLASRMRQAEFDEVTGAGNVPDNLRFALVGRTLRLDQTLSKLGGMVLSALSDAPLAAQAHARAGGEFLEGYQGAFAGITRLQSAEAKAAADLLDVGARSGAAHLSGRFTASDGPLGWGASMSRLFYKANLFELWSDGLRRGVAEMLSAHMGAQSALPYDQVHIGWRETLQRHGIDAGAWDLIRKGATKAEDGRTYLTFEALEAVPDADLHRWKGLTGKAATQAAADRARTDLEIGFRTLVQNHLDDAMTEARARERVGLTRGSKPGTVWGEAARSFTQFWSFNQALIGRHLAPAARGYAGKTPALLLAHLIIGTTLMGYASMQAKQIAKGREPRPIFDDEGNISLFEQTDSGWGMGRTSSTFLAAMLQGGGMGIYGDFLFGEVSRGGTGPIAALGGPLVGEAEKLVQITKAAMSGDVDDLPADMLKFGVSNTPFLNLFYARSAMDYAILYRLQEAASPGYLERYEKRVRDREGSEFFLPPSEVVR